MPVDAAYRPDPLFQSLGPAFADPVAPARFPRAIERFANRLWARRIGLGAFDATEWERCFARFEPLPDNMERPLAIRYHGHQFRVYNPDIGDGRGFLYAQLRDDRGRLLDLATKGSGQTPYSRLGDGRLTLKGGVREVLAAQMLDAQGVYTSKPFALYETGEALIRGDEPSPTRSAVLTRLSHSHIRFGVFQRLAFVNDHDAMRALVDHCAKAYFPEVAIVSEAVRPAALLDAVVQETARLVASWMAAGFVHGVMNTDNMTITGESFDYGPWRFAPASIPGFTAAYFDEHGLYCFARQPEAAAWNLAQLGGSLALVSDAAPLEDALRAFPARYRSALRTALFRRLGLIEGDLERDLVFVQALLGWLTESAAPWPAFFHDWFCGAASEARAMESPSRGFYERDDFAPIRDGFAARTPERPERLAHPVFQRDGAVSLLIEEVEALWAPIAADDDWSAFAAKLDDVAALREALAIADPM
jgi:uncharacterized protein YdiU (UPF0061 family)